jgi:galactokinase
LIDCRTLAARKVKITDDLAIMIVDSGVKRGLVDSQYNTRREQCFEAARFFGVPALRDLTLEQLNARRAELDDVVFRRARHIVTENQRVILCADALEAHDMATFGELMTQSHASMRDDFEITVPKVDRLVEILAAAIGGGARMTGGGFGGCVVGVLKRGVVADATEAVQARYRTPDGQAPKIYICSPSAGVRVVKR